MHIALWITVGVACLVLSGFLYQFAASLLDSRRFHKAGSSLVLQNGSRLFVRREGCGGPSVIFEAGIGASSLNWRHIQQPIARASTTFSYDRAGLGWSGSRSTSRNPSTAAAELRELLERAGVEPPFVLVGHSYGGLVMRRFALLYPREVAAVILIDPMRPEEWPPFHRGMEANLKIGARLCAVAIPIARFGIARLGLGSLLCGSGRVAERLSSVAGENCRYVLRRIRGEVAKMPAESRPELVALWSRPSFYAEMRAYLQAIPEIVSEIREAPPIHGIPVVVLTPGSATPLSDESLRGIGDHARQLIATKSLHWIHFDQPDLVIGAILDTVRAVTSERIRAAN